MGLGENDVWRETMNIWELKIVRVVSNYGNVSIDAPSVKQLLYENEGFKEFVRAIVNSVARGEMYDDSDGDYIVQYMPASKLDISERALELARKGRL